MSARQYLRQPSDASVEDSWTTAAENLGCYSNRMPIDPLRSARSRSSPLRPRGRHNAAKGDYRQFDVGIGRTASAALAFEHGRTPLAAAAVIRRPITSKRKTAPKYAAYHLTGSISSFSRSSIARVGGTEARNLKHMGSSRGFVSPLSSSLAPTTLQSPRNVPGSPLAVGGLQSPIYIAKDRVAEWTSGILN